MSDIVFGMSGQIGSGKSTIARSLAQALRCQSASFGSYIRSVARDRGFDDDRRTLQDLGQDMLNQMQPDEFCMAMLAQQVPTYVPGDRLVIDGVRHMVVADALEFLLKPARFALVYMRVDERVRRQRLQTRDVRLEELAKLDAHETERDVHERLRGRADITLLATRPSGELVRAVRDWQAAESVLADKRLGACLP